MGRGEGVMVNKHVVAAIELLLNALQDADYKILQTDPGGDVIIGQAADGSASLYVEDGDKKLLAIRVDPAVTGPELQELMEGLSSGRIVHTSTGGGNGNSH